MKVKTYALVDIQTLIVTNTILWDGLPSWSPPTGCTAIQLPEDSGAGIGWSYINGTFQPPTP